MKSSLRTCVFLIGLGVFATVQSPAASSAPAPQFSPAASQPILPPRARLEVRLRQPARNRDHGLADERKKSNLNRDYAKPDTPEMTTMLGELNQWQPDPYLDLHVTDGADYQYDITFGEVEFARSLSKKIIPIWREDSPLPSEFADRDVIDFRRAAARNAASTSTASSNTPHRIHRSQ